MAPSTVIAFLRHRLCALAGRHAPAWLCRRYAALGGDRVRALIAGEEACRADLLRFGRATDEEFTALAQGLGTLNHQLTDLRTQTESFRAILEDTDEERAIASAYTLYKNSVDLVHASMGIAISEQEQMGAIVGSLLHACKARDCFHRNHLLLRILTMSIRMESSRVEAEFQGVFLNVAADVAEIDQKITGSTEAAFGRIEAVVAEARTEQSGLKQLERNLHTQAQTSIRRIQTELDALRAALAPCAGQSRAIAELFAETAPLTLRVIGSLQHQDIVRQQLEHVAEGFSDLGEHLRETNAGPRGQTELEVGYVHHAAGVQLAQLESARHEFANAGTAVVEGLQALLQVSAALVEKFAAMETAGSAAFADCRVATLFREEIHQLARIADKSKEANDKISRLVQRIEEVVRVFTEEVGRHDLDVKIVALNAQIAAARVPSADALNKLAEETSLVSAANAEVTRELTTDLRASLDQLQQVKRDADDFLEIITTEKGALETGADGVSDKLTRLSERVQSAAARVRREFEQAYAEGHALLDNLRFPELAARCFEPALQMCAEITAATASFSDRASLSAAATARLEAHRGRYTMQKENALHTSAIDGAETAAAPAAGDGIELFAAEPAAEQTLAAAGAADPSEQTDRSDRPDPSADPAAAPPAASDLGPGIELF